MCCCVKSFQGKALNFAHVRAEFCAQNMHIICIGLGILLLSVRQAVAFADFMIIYRRIKSIKAPERMNVNACVTYSFSFIYLFVRSASALDERVYFYI